MNFEKFSQMVREAGYEPHYFKDKKTIYWGIRKSPLLVNFYPGTQKIYVCGTKSGFNGGPRQALDAARRIPIPIKNKCGHKIIDRRNKDGYRREKMILLTKDPHCFWCRIPLELDTSTLDHRIPLSRGGLDNLNNMVLACGPCNDLRSNKMPELESTPMLSAKQRRQYVIERFPKAIAIENPHTQSWIIKTGTEAIGQGLNKDQAWTDAYYTNLDFPTKGKTDGYSESGL